MSVLTILLNSLVFNFEKLIEKYNSINQSKRTKADVSVSINDFSVSITCLLNSVSDNLYISFKQ